MTAAGCLKYAFTAFFPLVQAVLQLKTNPNRFNFHAPGSRNKVSQDLAQMWLVGVRL